MIKTNKGKQEHKSIPNTKEDVDLECREDLNQSDLELHKPSSSTYDLMLVIVKIMQEDPRLIAYNIVKRLPEHDIAHLKEWLGIDDSGIKEKLEELSKNDEGLVKNAEMCESPSRIKYDQSLDFSSHSFTSSSSGDSSPFPKDSLDSQAFWSDDESLACCKEEHSAENHVENSGLNSDIGKLYGDGVNFNLGDYFMI
ncbi:hypothetical protein phytr_8950 [Candidatus Phycorickettsia trachydisci]|uniref:Uncharacterized protein n=1 Tax=Candidatus Phycorickettsia trachydisci TaxID=2115978 RepID=A0A2P1P993_9RICK|nr:hypothetical protein [Candidatus Phycorickettsia trachydisci]AVP87825.1 hypothetical protein phytr_8950 [Candidatus Phycorickettsia trachydisci]